MKKGINNMIKFDYGLRDEWVKIVKDYIESYKRPTRDDLLAIFENHKNDNVNKKENDKISKFDLNNLMHELTKVSENLGKETKETSSNIVGSMKLFAEQLVSSEKSKPKKLHIVELKDGRVLDVPFGKLVIVIDTFSKKDLEKCLIRDEAVFVLGSDIRMIQNVEV